MADIITPEKKSSSKGLLQAAGTAVGAYFGGPGGAAAGYQAGGMAADTISPARQPGQVKSDAMARRAQSLQAQQPQPQQDYTADLKAAEEAAAQLPEEQRAQYLPTLQRAREMSQQQRRSME